MKLVQYLRSNKFVYQFIRSFRMIYKRNIYGLKSVDSTFYMSGKSKVSKDFVAGAYGFMAEGCRVGPKVKVGKYVMFGPHVTITGSDHRFDLPGTPMIFAGRPKLEETIIEADVWIGHGSLIMSGVHIGRGTIVAAHSVVTKNIPNYCIYAGVPAKKIKNRFSSDADIQKHEIMLNSLSIQGTYCSPKC